MYICKQIVLTSKWLNVSHSFLMLVFIFNATLCITFTHSLPNFSAEVHSLDQEVVITLGSNVALRLMRKSGIHITRHACLYEIASVYVTNQPNFLNSSVRAVTQLGPHELLRALKKIEKDICRADGIRYGPKPINIDILFHVKRIISSEILTVPHERIWERPFVMAPLMDLLGSTIDIDIVSCWHSFSLHSRGLFDSWEKLGDEPLVGKEGLKRILPIGNGFWDRSMKTAKGADMIDIGVQSTRPMASRTSVQQGLDRLTPVLEAVLGLPEVKGKIVSMDTFYSEVAAEVVSKGAHIVNDVSTGQLDSNMGDPSTMQNSENLQYDYACKQVALELYLKNHEHSLEFLIGLPNIQAKIERKSLALSHVPILIGPSRKKFLGEICNRTAATERDAATVALHNVRDNVDAVKLCDAVLRQRRSIPPSWKK
ncbi:folic acid synthesis protein fol1-like [Pyrus ussuriensis x Pyrus communis]|uniref:2-amino-4-hydroxy-6-hydroxymethyldihydropteridine diphosphokinase n=1 Tax=Pyrus ussuriensis x Pyrus communis TaxID=2448454 RepID=A0A5N5I118_9ROSA|nr:folic acid synthesis protein fol1-like [Pyrus ussuriensis x Pyrus communis]